MKTPARPLLKALVGDEAVEACFSDEAEIAAMLRVEAALAEAEAAEGLIAPAAAARIVEVCARFEPDRAALARGLARDGVAVPELVKQLRAAVGEPHAGAVHRGATSQDIVDTALMLRLRSVVEIHARRLDALIAALYAVRARDGAVPLMAHTRMQRALPFTAASKIDTWVQPLERHKAALAELAPGLLVVQLGGPVGTRDELDGRGDAVASALARGLGLGCVPQWHSQRERIGAFGSFLSLLTGTLGKIGQDVALMAQNELGEARLASGGTSSAMAHKSNPVPAEVLVALARFNAGLVGTLHQALVHENERSGAAWTLEWLVLPPMAVSAGAALERALDLAQGLSLSASRGL